jgi:glucosylceramidase
VVQIQPDVAGRTWIGVGGALTDASTSLLASTTAVDLLFSPTREDGARLNLVRLPLSSTDFSTRWWTWGWDPATGQATMPDEARAAASVIVDGILPIRHDLNVVAVPWTAPVSLKTNDDVRGGTLTTGAESGYANMLVAQVDMLAQRGVQVRALSLQNEPGNSSDYPTMLLSTTQQATLGRLLAGPLSNRGVELWALEHNWADRPSADETIGLAPDTFDRIAFHCYRGSPSDMAGERLDVIVTECTGETDGFPGTLRWDAINLVVDSIRAGSTGLMFWNLALDPQHGPKLPGGCTLCRGLLTIDPSTGVVTRNPEFYTLAHLARAASPGAAVVDLTTEPDIPAVAFRNLDGSIGLFGYNDSGSGQVVELRVAGGESHRIQVQAGEMFSTRG